MQSIITFNIGLNNNPLKVDAIIELIESTGISVLDYRTEIGQYIDSPEPTLVLDAYSNMNVVEIAMVTERLCAKMTQECIAIKVNGNGLLIYNDSHTGDRYAFDEKYFINFFNPNNYGI